MKTAVTTSIGKSFTCLIDAIYGKERNKKALSKEVKLKTRKINLSRDQRQIVSEKDSYEKTIIRNIDPTKTALLLMDVWDTTDEPNVGWARRHDEYVEAKILPLINLMRKNKGKIIHANHGFKISPRITPLENEMILSIQKLPERVQTLYLYGYLKKNRINTLLYAGNSTHKCLFFRPDGIYAMSTLFKDLILVRDCTLAFEYLDTLQGEWSKVVFTHLIEEQYGTSTTLSDLEIAFKNR